MFKIDEKTEELLEAIWIALEDEERERGMEPDGVDQQALGHHLRQLDQLLTVGLARVPSEGRVALTAEGRQAASSLMRRHRLAERLVVDVLDLHGDIMDEYACHFEHLVHTGLEERICTLLGHPRVCPHGKPIPPGNCCQEDKHDVGQLVVKLVDLHPGQRGTIAYLHAEDQSRLSKLLAMGVLPGSDIQLKRRIPTFVFQVGFSQFAVDEEVAGAVFVRLEG
jgi:DtxR family Mn-dependent transcriptional regulator